MRPKQPWKFLITASAFYLGIKATRASYQL
jgi:hypothetical protein